MTNNPTLFLPFELPYFQNCINGVHSRLRLVEQIGKEQEEWRRYDFMSLDDICDINTGTCHIYAKSSPVILTSPVKGIVTEVSQGDYKGFRGKDNHDDIQRMTISTESGLEVVLHHIDPLSKIKMGTHVDPYTQIGRLDSPREENKGPSPHVHLTAYDSKSGKKIPFELTTAPLEYI